jgi:hypothetical protein
VAGSKTLRRRIVCDDGDWRSSAWLYPGVYRVDVGIDTTEHGAKLDLASEAPPLPRAAAAAAHAELPPISTPTPDPRADHPR